MLNCEAAQPLNRAQRRAKAKAKPVRAKRLLDPVGIAVAGCARMSPDDVRGFVQPLRELLGRIMSGTEQFGEWTRIRDAALVTEALMQLDSAKTHITEGLVEGWMLAIESAVSRRRKGPRDGLTGKEREELGLMLTWYETMLSDATQQRVLEAQRMALRRVKAALAEINKQVRVHGGPECGLGRDLARLDAIERGAV